MNLLGMETAAGHLYSSWNVNWDRPALIGLDVFGPLAEGREARGERRGAPRSGARR